MPFLNPSTDEAILSELRDYGVIENDLIREMMDDPEEFRLIDKLLQFSDKIPHREWTNYLCHKPEMAYLGAMKPSHSFIRSLEIKEKEKETLLNFGVLPITLKNETLWMCGIHTPKGFLSVAQEMFDSLSFKSIRYCAIPVSTMKEIVDLI